MENIKNIKSHLSHLSLLPVQTDISIHTKTETEGQIINTDKEGQEHSTASSEKL